MKASPISSRFYTGEIGQLDKPIRRNSCTESPSFGVTGFEIGECFTTDRVDENIARLTVQSFTGAGKRATEPFELSDIHERTVRRLTSSALAQKDVGRTFARDILCAFIA